MGYTSNAPNPEHRRNLFDGRSDPVMESKFVNRGVGAIVSLPQPSLR